MPLASILIDPETKRWRSGWRVAIFYVVLLLPNLLVSLFISQASAPTQPTSVFAVDWSMIAVYFITVIWVVIVSIACLVWLDGLSWRAVGYQLHQGWSRDLWIGLGLGASMIALIVALQILGGGTQLRWAVQETSLGLTLREILTATLLLWLAAAFEELAFRGYALQTLLRDLPAWVPVLALSSFFGLAHWMNPSRTSFSTLNTVLAGVWLAVALLRTRSLWLATGLHFSWNWMMGVFFGLPVSGMRLPHTLFFATSEAPHWLTGGSYGSEGGVTATLAFSLAALWLWRSNALRIAPETSLAINVQPSVPATLRLNLSSDLSSDLYDNDQGL